MLADKAVAAHQAAYGGLDSATTSATALFATSDKLLSDGPEVAVQALKASWTVG
jgi:hypothetical protein